MDFALLAPVLVLLMLATTDLVQFLRIKLRLDEVATAMASLVTQNQNLYASDFPIFFTDAQTMAGAVSVTGDLGATIISGIVNSNGAAIVAWQQKSPGNNTFTSQIGAAGGAATLPGQYTLPAGESLVAVEAYTSATVWVLSARLMGGPGSTSLRSYAVYQPRSVLLSQINSGQRP